jgi:hypothetical protein
MKRMQGLTLTAMLLCASTVSQAQQANAAVELVSTWTLAAVEKAVSSGQPTRVSGRGLLVMDAAGYVFEFFSTASRDLPESPRLDPQRTFADYGGFWGRYEVDSEAGRIEFESADGVSPDVQGIEFARDYEVDGDWLVMTSANEPQAQGDTRWTWQRVPTIENLSPAYREVVGFWRHIDEQRIDVATGEVQSTRQRAPSVIVYTPGGFVGVHFPSLGRTSFAADAPTLAEAEAAYRGYLGYYGALAVYPGEVSHNVLGGVSPSAGAILRRYADITGDELVVRIQSLAPAADRPQFATTVHLRRLSGVEDMLPPTP